jgi:hypothetical protein
MIAAAAPLAAILTAAFLAASHQPQRFVLTGKTVHGKGYPMHITASGPITGTGLGVGAHLKNGSDRTTLRLSKGTVVISSHQTALSAKPNYRTCTAAILEHGVFTIVAGTGSYAGVTGAGTYIRRSHLVGARSAAGACLGRNAQPVAVYDQVTLTGTANIH